MVFALVLMGWIFSLSLHEFAHALVAYWGGDWTVREKGYLTLNPLRYTHPLYSLILPLLFLILGGFGLPGGAVYIETWRLRNERWRSAVSLAGPLTNLLLALFLALILKLFPQIGNKALGPSLAFLGMLQITAFLLNILPIPPLDGFGIIEPYLPRPFLERLLPYRQAFFWIFLLALYYIPLLNGLFWTLVFLITTLIGIPPHLVLVGYDQFFFWR
ncbi:MAG: site-2 protease family protein [Chloroflexi bacterium]|jgi:Zn-dependent protease|nr:site-2 protease family protein [Chloroflexota bacterium]